MLRTALLAVVLHTAVLGEERQVDNLALLQLARGGGNGDGVVVGTLALNLLSASWNECSPHSAVLTTGAVAATAVVRDGRAGRVIVGVAVKGDDVVARRAAGRGNAGQSGSGDSGGSGSHLALLLTEVPVQRTWLIRYKGTWQRWEIWLFMYAPELEVQLVLAIGHGPFRHESRTGLPR